MLLANALRTDILELEDMQFPISTRWRCTWGRRRAGENLPAPPLKVVASTDPYALGANDSSTVDPTKEYQQHQIYMTRDESMKATDQRDEGLKRLPVPLVIKIKEENRKTVTAAEGEATQTN